MNSIEYFFHVIAFGLVVFTFVGIPLAAVLQLIQWLGPSPIRYVFYPIVALLVLILVFGEGWFARTAAQHRVNEGADFVDAMWDTLDEVRLYCSFLPVLGKFLNRPEGRDTRFDEPPRT